MDEILYLEPDEEITTVIDKLKKSEGRSVGLVIPRNSTLIHSIVNLKLLKKEAETNDREIALVTTDKIGKNIAAQVGLQVYEDVHAKRPSSGFSMPELPKGDEVIEVDMSKATPNDDLPTGKGQPKIKHYRSDTMAPGAGTKADSDQPTMTDRGDDEADTDNSDERPVLRQKSVEKSAEKMESFSYESDSEHAAHLKAPQMARSGFSAGGAGSKRGLIVFLSIFIVFILVTLLALPQSWVTVTVAAEPFEKSLELTIDKEATQVDASQRIIPGKLLSINKDDAKRVVATGQKNVGGKAKGTVTLSNAYQSSAYDLAAGTTLTAGDGKTFSLTEKVSIPGATVTLVEGQLVTSPGKTTATIAATEPGDAYNIKPTKFTISGLSGDKAAKITAESTKDFSGGFTKQVTIMTQADIDGAKEVVVGDLAKQAAEELHKQAKDLKLIEEAVTSEVVSIETNPAAVDSETDYFDIKVKTKNEVMVFDEKAVQELVNTAIQAEVPEDKELLLGEGDEFVVSVSSTNYAEGQLTLESKVKTKIGTRIDAKAAKKGLAGKSEQAIREQLMTLPNAKEVQVTTFPRWWWQDTSFVPLNTRLQVVYQ